MGQTLDAFTAKEIFRRILGNQDGLSGRGKQRNPMTPIEIEIGLHRDEGRHRPNKLVVDASNIERISRRQSLASILEAKKCCSVSQWILGISQYEIGLRPSNSQDS